MARTDVQDIRKLMTIAGAAGGIRAVTGGAAWQILMWTLVSAIVLVVLLWLAQWVPLALRQILVNWRALKAEAKAPLQRLP